MELVFLSQLLLAIFSISVSLFFLFYVSKTKTTTGNLQPPPGSTGWPFIGETFEYLSLAKKNCIEKFIFDRQNKYSSKHFKTSYIGETMVFICSTEGNKFLFSYENKKLFKPWLPRNVEKIFPHDVEFSTTEETKRMRKQVSTLFTQHAALENNIVTIDALAKEHFQTHWNCKEVKVHPLIQKFTLAVTCRLMLNIQESETLQQLEKLFNCILSGLLALPINIPGTKFYRAIRASEEIRRKLQVIIEQRKIEVLGKSNQSDSSEDLLSQILLGDYKNGEEVTDTDIVSTMLGYIVAGYDTTSTAIVTILKYLAELPQVYDEIRREQMEIANSKGPEALLNLDDLKKMRYSWNVACEILRLQPPIPGIWREAVTDFSFDGCLIPKGWKLYVASHGTHKSAEYFPEPEKFDPSRFEGNKIAPFSYVPFGGGAHICPGRDHARLLILVFVHNVVKNFRWEKVIPDEELIRAPLLAPEKGLPIRLYPHEA